MTEQSTKRNGMLATIYNMLPKIDNDYAAKLVYTLENKKDLQQLTQDIANISAQLGSDSLLADTFIAKILLDEITLAAALRQLHVYNNATSITELCEALQISQDNTQLLLQVYASLPTRQYFDEAFSMALKDVQNTDLPDEQKAKHAVEILIENADKIKKASDVVIKQNAKGIIAFADKYHLRVKLTAELKNLYTQPASILVLPELEKLVEQLSKQNEDISLCASLSARVMIGQLTKKDAQAVAYLSKLLNNWLLEDDLMIIACRYLKAKEPTDIALTFNAVLKKLPHVDSPEENLALAVQVLLDGTADSFSHSVKVATIRRDRSFLQKKLEKNSLFYSYEHDIAEQFGGKKNFEQILSETEELLSQLPFCVERAENKELACKVLLGSLSLEEAKKQAQYLRDLKAKTVTKGIAPELLKSYLGTKSPEEVVEFFENTLKNYTFWKSDREKHVFSLGVLIDSLNGVYNQRVVEFVLEMLEKGISMTMLEDMLTTIKTKKYNSKELEELLQSYCQARV